MYKKLLSNNSLLILLLLGVLSYQGAYSLKAQDTSLTFLSISFEEAKNLSKSTGKLIFIDCYTNWCGPCKWVDANIFTNDSVIRFYNANFICLKMDMEKGEGIALRKTYSVNAFPTFLFLNQAGIVQERRAGQLQTAMDFVDFGLLAMNPFANLRAHEFSFESGARTDDFLMKYAKKLSNAYLQLEMHRVLDTLYSQWSDEDFYREKNFDFYSKLDTDMNGKAVGFFIENYDDFENLFGERAKSYLKIIFSYNTLIAKRKADEKAELRINEKLNSLNDSLQAMIQWHLGFNGIVADPEAQMNQIKAGAKRFVWNEASDLSSFASVFLYNAEKESDFHFALEMVERSLLLEAEPFAMETKAYILLKLNQKEEAQAILLKAIELAKERSVPNERMLNKLQELQNDKH